MKRLLLLSCTESKRETIVPLPALELYDGPSFQVVRKFLRENTQKELVPVISVLSAQHGLISSTAQLRQYNMKMTEQLALDIRSEVQDRLLKLINEYDINELFIVMSKMYSKALGTYRQYLPANITIICANGNPGCQLAQLKRWLYNGNLPIKTDQVTRRRNQLTIQGVQFPYSASQVTELAQIALAQRAGQPYRYHSWYVLIDDQRVSPKWLVSVLSGLPPSEFHTHTAIRVLEHLGIAVFSA